MAAATDNRAVALDAIKKAGFPQEQWNIALAVATAESGLNPRAVNNKNRNGTSDYGLFQINSIHKPTAQEKVDPYANAKRAYRIWKDAGGKWSPWSAYNNGAYKSSLKGIEGIPNLPGMPGNNPALDAGVAAGGAVGGALDAAKASVDSALAKLEEFLNLYIVVIIGLVLIILGIIILARDRVGKLAVNMVTKGAAKHLNAGKAVKAVKGAVK